MNKLNGVFAGGVLLLYCSANALEPVSLVNYPFSHPTTYRETLCGK
jgi:hypothetical protein